VPPFSTGFLPLVRVCAWQQMSAASAKAQKLSNRLVQVALLW